MLLYIFNYILHLHFIHQLLHYFLPETYNSCYNFVKKNTEKTAVCFIFNCIYYYSVLQLYASKANVFFIAIWNNNNLVTVKDFINDFITHDNNLFSEEKYNFISIIKNGDLLEKIIVNQNNLSKSINDFFKYENFDIIIYHHFNKNIFMITYNKNNIPFDLNECDYHYTNFKFIQIEVNIRDISFLIDLKTEEYNFYITDNFIDSNLIIYILKTYYSKKIENLNNEDLMNYTLKIIDHEVNVIEINNTDILYFHQSNYIITKKKLEPDLLEEAKNRKVSSSMNFIKEENNDMEEIIVEDEYIDVKK